MKASATYSYKIKFIYLALLRLFLVNTIELFDFWIHLFLECVGTFMIFGTLTSSIGYRMNFHMYIIRGMLIYYYKNTDCNQIRIMSFFRYYSFCFDCLTISLFWFLIILRKHVLLVMSIWPNTISSSIFMLHNLSRSWRWLGRRRWCTWL